MRRKAFYFAIISLILLFSCCKPDKEFPLYRVNSFPLEQVHVGGLIGEYFEQHQVNSLDSFEEMAFETELLDSIDSVEFRVSKDHIGESISRLNGFANRYANTGDERFLDEAKRGWQNIVENYLSVLGMPLSNQEGIHESNELLADWVKLNTTLLKITGEPQYAAQLENTVYNTLLSETESRTDSTSTMNKSFFQELVPHFYTRYLDEIYVNIFGSSSMQYNHTTGGSVRIVQNTNYPYDGLVRLKFELDDKRYVDLHIRIPEWAEKASVTVGGVKYKALPGEYAQVTKMWKTGDEVEIILPMKPVVIEKNERFANINNLFFGLNYGALNLATSLCDTTDDKGLSFKGTDPYPHLRFVSPPGKVPTFTFDGIKDTTLVFQPYFLIANQADSNCLTNWIKWDN